MAKNPEMIEWALRRSIDNNKLLIDAFGIVGFIEE